MGMRLWPAVLVSPLCMGCADDAAPRAQWLVSVGTDLPTVSQALADERLSLDAAVDTLRVDVIRPDGTLDELRELIVADARDWPVSFGVAPDSSEPTLLRIRAFASRYSTAGTALGQSVLEPLVATTVDRLLLLEAPHDGVQETRVLLSGDCIGVPAGFSPRATCIDAARPSAAPDAGSADGAMGSPGSWALALEQPCEGEPTDGTVCIPGGFSVLGSVDDVGLADGTVVLDDPVPPQPVVVSPFFLDVQEVTVGQLRQLVNKNPTQFPTLPQPKTTSGSYAHCTWLGKDDPANDALPLTCGTFSLAEATCAARGGRLPSEAEWEHAARGRGQGRRYPWGDESPSCCTLVAGGKECGWPDPAPGGEAATLDCKQTDRSRDGVLDLAGNVAEVTRDDYATYGDAACWGAPGIHDDPVCHHDSGAPAVTRGGSFMFEPSVSTASLRSPFLKSGTMPGIGFRCVLPGGKAP